MQQSALKSQANAQAVWAGGSVKEEEGQIANLGLNGVGGDGEEVLRCKSDVLNFRPFWSRNTLFVLRQVLLIA